MADLALLVAMLAVAYLGFALLALSQDRHWLHLGGPRHCPPKAVRTLRIAGYALLLIGLVLAFARDGPSFGVLLWATMLTVCALAVVCTLAWRARWLRPLAAVCRRIA